MGRRFASATAAVALVLLGCFAAPAAAAPPAGYEPSVAPAGGAPGDEIEVVFPANGDNLVIDRCAAAFVSDPVFPREPPLCPRVFRLTVPEVQSELLPLRWKVQRNQNSVVAPQEGTIGFKVLPPVVVDETSAPVPEISEVVTGPASPQVGVIEPEFGVSVSPLTAAAGDRITVEVFPVDEGVRILGCLVAFQGDSGAACLPSEGRWLADVPVPAGTPPGWTNLRWGVEARTADRRPVAENGMIRYPVAVSPVPPASPASPTSAVSQASPASGVAQASPARGGPVRAPGPAQGPDPVPVPAVRPLAFAVRPEPAAARAGEHVTVSHVSLVDGVTITGCTVGFAEDSPAVCRPDGGGWLADVAVPGGTKPGPGALQWRLAYQRAGTTGATDGLLSFTVLSQAENEDEQDGGGFWRKLLRQAGKIALLGALIAVFIAGRGLLSRVRRLLQKDGDEPDTAPPVDVVPLSRPDHMTTVVSHTDPWPVHLVTATPRLDPRLQEEA